MNHRDTRDLRLIYIQTIAYDEEYFVSIRQKVLVKHAEYSDTCLKTILYKMYFSTLL